MAIRPPVALIAGPTATGKSALALALAVQSGGVIVNADSAQIYRDLPILSAAPDADERAQAEHKLYGALDGSEPCSAADWATMAKQEIAGIHSAGQLPILVGGTGLYLRTLLDGIAPVPPIDATIRQEVRATPVEDNHRRLTDLDRAAAAKLNLGDTTRIARALEVVLSTGKRLSDWQTVRSGGIGQQIGLKPMLLLPPRDWLNRRCDVRFANMVERGAADEVEALLERKLDPALPVMRAIGVREIAAWLEGALTRDQAITAGQLATRQYAKRQYTWFANQPPEDWPRFREVLDQSGLAEALALLRTEA
jgi:tRNA dimethylallyltransferase